MKHRLISLFMALMLVCSLLTGCSGNANPTKETTAGDDETPDVTATVDDAAPEATATGEHQSLVTTINETRIGFMKSQINADDELLDRMVFTYYVSEKESSDPSFTVEMYTSRLGERISIRSENGQIMDVWYITPLCPPLPRTTDSDADVARFLGIANAVTISEILFGGSMESGSAAQKQLINELYVNTEGKIETENMSISFSGWMGNEYSPDRKDWNWWYVFTKK